MNNKKLVTVLLENYKNKKEPITYSQLGETDFYELLELENELFKKARMLYQLLNNNSEEFQVVGNELMSQFTKINATIGKIKDYRLNHNYAILDRLLPLYATTPASDKEEKCYKINDDLMIFRIRFENYIARQIIIQQGKSKDILDGEHNDIELIREYRKKRNKKAKKNKKNIKNSTNGLPINNLEEVRFTDTLVVKKEIVQPINENFIEKDVVFNILKSNGLIIKVKTTIKYSKLNKRYYIRKEPYKLLKQNGIILCRIIQASDSTSGASTFAGAGLRGESKLHEYGYNVNQIDALTTEQRKVILEKVIDNKIYKVGEIIHLLEFFISCNKNSTKKDMQTAIHKWEHDIDFIKSKIEL